MALEWKNNYSQYQHYFIDNVTGLYKKKKSRAYTGFAFTILAIAFFTFFAIKPTIITIIQLLKTLDDQRQVMATLQQKITSLKKAQDEFNLDSNRFVLLDSALPNSPQEEILAQKIEYLAQKNQITLDRLKFDRAILWENVVNSNSIQSKTNDTSQNVTKSAIAEIQGQNTSSTIALSPSVIQNEEAIKLDITVNGNYANLKQFINDLTSLRRIIKINTFNFTPTKGDAQDLTSNIQVITYLLRY